MEVVEEESKNDEDFKKVWESLSKFRENYKVWKDLGYLQYCLMRRISFSFIGLLGGLLVFSVFYLIDKPSSINREAWLVAGVAILMEVMTIYKLILME